MFRSRKNANIFTVLVLLSLLLNNKVLAASLNFSPTSLSMKSGEKKNLTVVLDTQGKNVVGAISTIKITSGSDVVQINSVDQTSSVGFNEMKKGDVTSSGDGRVSFTVIKEVGAFYTGVVNIATIQVEALKKGTAVLEFTLSDSIPSTVSDENSNEILATRGTATIKVDSSSSSSNNDDDDNDDDNNSSSNNSSSNNSSNNNAAVPTTGSTELFYLSILGATFVGLSFGIKKVFLK